MEIKLARLDDAEILYNWRNDSLTRAMSKSSSEVSWTDHLDWLKERLSRGAPNIFIARIGEEPVGTFRIDDGKISYTVSPGHRGNGVGAAMLFLAREMVGSLIAEIYENNIASIKIATRAGLEVRLLSVKTHA